MQLLMPVVCQFVFLLGAYRVCALHGRSLHAGLVV